MSYTYCDSPLHCSLAEQELKDYETMKKLTEEKLAMSMYPMNPGTLVGKKDKYWAVSTNGAMSTFEVEDDAIDVARRWVAKDDKSEVAVLKLSKFVRVDKPVVTEDIE